jgi:sulfoxide reductase heme-binding subunit YedZ
VSKRRLAAWVVLALAVAALAVVGLLARSQGGTWDPTRKLWLARGTGWTAVGALMIALSATPVARLRPRLQPFIAPFRRAFGIAAGSLALLHAATVLFGHLRGAWGALWNVSYLRAGLLALAILIVMLITSFPWLVKRLRVRLWKPLHRLGYLAALLVLVHLLLSPWAPRPLTLELFGALFVVGLLRLIPSREAALDETL